jgi:hypothetical protein
MFRTSTYFFLTNNKKDHFVKNLGEGSLPFRLRSKFQNNLKKELPDLSLFIMPEKITNTGTYPLVGDCI